MSEVLQHANHFSTSAAILSAATNDEYIGVSSCRAMHQLEKELIAANP